MSYVLFEIETPAGPVLKTRRAGGAVTEVIVTSRAKLLTEGTQEFLKLVGPPKPKRHEGGAVQPPESLEAYIARATELARAGGYDVIVFRGIAARRPMEDDTGTAILNEEVVLRRQPRRS